MAIFEVKKDNAIFEIDAADENAALAAFKSYYTPQVAFETKIPADQEPAFQKWKAINARLPSGDLDSGADYDYHGAFLAGENRKSPEDHLTDKFKKPNHPTFSDQSQYAQYGKPGSWDGETYIPAGGAKPPAEPEGLLSEIGSAAMTGLQGTARVAAAVYNEPFSISQQLVDAAIYHTPAAFASALEGRGAKEGEPDWKDALIERASAISEKRNADPNIPDAVKNLGPSIGFSLVSMLGGAAAGVGTTTAATSTGAGVFAAPLLGWTAGVTASGALAYRMSTNQFTRQLYDAANADSVERTGKPISAAEWKVKQDKLAPLITEYGLFEAVPEALSQGLELKILKAPIKAGIANIFGKNILTRFATKTASVYGVELATETFTQQGQNNVEVEATGKGTPRSWTSAADLGESFKEVAPSVILQTAIMGGGAKTVLMLRDRIRRGGLTPKQFDAIQELNNMVDSAQIDPEGALQAAVRLLDPNSYDPNLIRPSDNINPAGPVAPVQPTALATVEPATPTPPVAPRQTAAEIEAKLARTKANVLNGAEGIEPLVERITDQNETVDDTIAAANLAAGTVPNPVTVPDYIDQGYEIVPGALENSTRLTKTNDDNTIHTVEIDSNGDRDIDTTMLGDFTENEVPFSVLRDNIRGGLTLIQENGFSTEMSVEATRRHKAGVPLLDVLRFDEPNTTIEPVVRTETVAPAVTQAALFPEPDAIEQNRDRSNPASVLQMRQIANAPDYGRAGVGTSLANDAPIVAGGNIPADQIGNKSIAVDTDGKRTNIQYAVVDASTVQTSNTVDGAVNPNYAGSEDLRAIAGNGRITGFSEAYVRGTADNYRAEFEADTAHGIDPEVIRSVPNPILVRVMSEADITSDMGDRTNTATQLGMNPEETARNDANRIDLDALTFRENGAPTAAATRAFVEALPANERASLLTGQVPTTDATTRLNRAVFLKAYNDSALMDQLTTSDEGRTVISALTQLAPVMSRLSEAGNLDIRDIVVDAAKIVIETGNKGLPLSDAARQTDLAANPDANLVVALIAENPRSAKNTVAVLRSVAEFAYAEATKPETDMFGATPRATRADVVAKLRKALSPASAQLVMPGTETVATAPSKAVELAQLKGRQTKMGRTGQEAPGGIFTAAEAAKQSDLEAKIADLNAKADTQGRRTVAGRILSLTAAHLAAPTKESRTKLELALTNKTATTATYNTNVQVAEAVDAARAALAPAQTEQTAPLAVGDSVRVGNVMGVVVGVENGYIKFHPITAKNPKAYQRVATTTATLISRPDTSATSARSETVGLSVDLAQMAERFGADMYGSNLMEVVVKEGLQNSFDAVKGRLFLQMAAKKEGVDDLSDAAKMALFEAYLLANPKSFGHVKITLNSVDRTVTFSDDGVGMSSDIVKKAFLTIAASDKAGLPAGLSSGGLGLAKMGILMGAARIQLTTVRGGVQTSIDTTKTELLAKTTTFNVNKTNEPPGTTLTLTIPETFTAKNGDEVGIHFQPNPDYVTALQRPLIGPVEVEVTAINSYGTSTKVIATGTNFDTSKYQDVKTADTHWGRINIYFGVERKQNPNHVVLSSGVYQFDYPVVNNRYESIPFDITINILPKYKASERDYPFENNRERFKPRVQNDLDGLRAYLLAIAQGESAKDLKEGFKDVVSMPRIEVGAALADNSKKLKKAFDARNSGEVEELAPLPDEVTITSGTVIDARGAVIAQSDAAAKEAEKKSPSTFVEKEAAPDVAAFMSDMKADPRQPTFLNNTSVDYLAVGRPYGNPEAFFAELGTLMVEMKEELAKSGIYGYDALSAKELFFGGIAIDRKYGGVHIRVPFKAVFVNPFYDWGAKTLFGVRGNLYETMTHEIAHVRDMSHGVGHNNEMIRVRQYLEDQGMEQYFRDAILDLLIRHESTFTAMRTAYGQSTTKNIGKPLDEYKGNTPSASARGSATRVEGELGPVRAGEGLGRGGDLQAAGSPGEQGEVGGGAGRVAAVTNPQIDTPQFKRWFGKSKVVNEKGEPLVLYHGSTAKNLSRFDLRKAVEVEGGFFFTSNEDVARQYTFERAYGDIIGDRPLGTVTPVYLTLKNPLVWKTKLGQRIVDAIEMTRAIRKAKANGNDGVIVRNIDDSVGATGEMGDSYIAFDSTQIKSAIGNNGQFDPLNPDIRYSVKSDKMGATGTAKAWVEFAEVKKLIDFGVVKTLAQAKTAAEADYTKTFEALPAFDAKAYLEGVVAVEGPLLPPNIHAAVQAYRDGNEGGAVGRLLADVERAREANVARWENYFDNVNTEQGSDPFWKSYVAHGVVDTFDATKPNTGETFNAAALATVYAKFLEGTAPNFTKAYRAAKMAATADLVQLGDAQNGWRKVPRTAKSDPDFAERVAEVQAISSESWCTRTYNAAPYIQDGDFWVYVDKGRPELAIRFEGSDVAEIQGRANNGSIPSQYADKVQELVDSGKIQNLSPKTKRALQAATDRSIALKKLESETTFVEEMIDPNDDGSNIRVYRKTNGDIVIVTEGSPDLPEKYADRVVEVIGDLILREGAQANNLTTVGGNLNLYEGAQANNVTTVGGTLYLYEGAQANNVTTVGGSLYLSEGAQANNLTTVGGNLYLGEGAQANNLTTVGGDLNLYGGAQANNVTTVGGDLNLYGGAQANNLTTVGGTLYLSEGAQANNLTTVGGDLNLYEGAQANNVTTVGGDLNLYEGAQANNVTTVGGSLYLGEGAQALSLQAVGGTARGAAPENTPRLKYIGDKEAVERIKAETLSARVVTTGRTSAGVQSAISRATRNLRIKTNVYATVAEASAATGVDIPADVQAMYSGKELHFILGNISSDLDAEIAVWHEVTHAGLDRLYGSGSAEYNVALTTIALRNPEIQKEAAKWRAKFGADILQRAQEKGMTAEKAAQYVRMRAIDEALAVMSSQNVNIRGLDKFIAAVQKILRQVGLTKLADAIEGKTNAEALSLISKARGALLADGSYVVTGTTPAFLRGAGLQTRPLKVTGTGRNGIILNWDVGQAFTRAHKAQYGRVLNIDNPADRAEMVRSLNAEYRNQTRQLDNGEKWYVGDIETAIETTSTILPELRIQDNRDLFLVLTALLSPQQKPNPNWQNAIHAMRGYIETGRITLVKPNGTQFGVPSQTTSLQLLQHLIDTKGLEETLRWLNTSHSGKEIAEVRRASGLYETKATLSGYVASETNLTGDYLGILMFGPKVGSFALNTIGTDPNDVTVDSWMARIYNRLLGRLTDVSPQKEKDREIQSDVRSPAERESIKSLIRDVAAQNGVSPSAMQAALWYFEQRLYRQHGLNAESQNFSGAAALAVRTERPGGTGDVQRAGENEIPATTGRGKNRKVVTSIPYNSVQTTTRLNKLEKETDPVALKEGVAALSLDLRLQAANKPVRERTRGYDWIHERLLRAARRGEMNREQVRLGMWLLNSNPNLANDLGISIRVNDKPVGISGDYNPMLRVMSLFKPNPINGFAGDTLIAHEILHHAERMMPREVQDGIRAEWLSQIEGMLAAAIRTGNDEMVEHLRDTLRGATGNTAAYGRVADAVRNGTLSKDFYQYINPSEFWAVNAADIVAGRASESWVQRAVQWLKEFSQKIKEVFGLPSTAAVIRGLDNVINAANEGERQSPNMLADGGTFNVMGTRTEDTLPETSSRLEFLRDQTRYGLVDRFVDLKDLMAVIRSLASKLPEKLDAYKMIMRLSGRVAEKMRAFNQVEYRALLRDMKARAINRPELEQYLWMRAAKDANKLIAAQGNIEFKDGGAGVTTADAQAYLDALTPEKQTALEALADRVYAMTRETQDVLVGGGLATRESVEKERTDQPYYVPFRRAGKEFGMGIGQGVSVRGPNYYHREGSKLPVVDILANIIKDRSRAYRRVESNSVSGAIRELAQQFPDKELWKIAQPKTMPAINAETGEPVTTLDMTYESAPNVVMSFRLGKNGKLIAQGVEFNESRPRALRMARALKNLDGEPSGRIIKFISIFTRYFARVNTQYNLVFGVINLLRDVPSAWLNLTTTPIAGKQYELTLHIPAALRTIYGVLRAERKGVVSYNTKYESLYQRFRQAGGASGWSEVFDSSSDLSVRLQKDLDALSHGTIRKVLPGLGALVTDYNSALENSTRLAAFITAVNAGVSDAEAASLAKNLTVNFDRRGAYTSQMSGLYAFLNASIQGSARVVETLRGPAGKKIIAGGLLLGAMDAVFMAMAGFDDDDPPEFLRQRNFIIPTGNGNYKSVPMPLGFNVLPNIGRLMMQTILNPKKAGDNAVAMTDAVLAAFDPLGTGGILELVSPTILDPLVAVKTNRDWTGKPIERRDFSDLDPTPGFTRARDSATVVSRFLAETLNTVTGGNRATPGWLSPTPDMLDYLAGQATGGAGRELLNLETSVEGWIKGTDVPSYKIPLIGRFYGKTDSNASQIARYYENTLTLNKLENNIKDLEKNYEDSTAYETDNPMVEIIEAANIIKRTISDLRAEKKEPGSDDVSLDAQILDEMKSLNELAAPYNAPTTQQKFLRDLVTE